MRIIQVVMFMVVGIALIRCGDQEIDSGTIVDANSIDTVLITEGIKYAYPRWSANGDTVLFQGNQSGHWQVYSVAADGGKLTQITHDSSNNFYPDWSPNNDLIAFVSDRDGNEEIYVMNSDGTSVRNLTNHPARDIHPYWTGDGKRVLFNSTRDDPDNWSLDIYEMNADGGDVTQLSEGRDVETCARPSPGGDKLVYLGMSRETETDDLWLMNADGSQAHRITADPERDGWPAWSPDGGEIVFSSMINGQFHVVMADTSGADRRIITHPQEGVQDTRPQISPDGRTILFNREFNDSTIAIVTKSLD